MLINSKYRGKCRKCGKDIEIGERVDWERGYGARHIACLDDSGEENNSRGPSWILDVLVIFLPLLTGPMFLLTKEGGFIFYVLPAILAALNHGNAKTGRMRPIKGGSVSETRFDQALSMINGMTILSLVLTFLFVFIARSVF